MYAVTRVQVHTEQATRTQPLDVTDSETAQTHHGHTRRISQQDELEKMGIQSNKPEGGIPERTERQVNRNTDTHFAE